MYNKDVLAVIFSYCDQISLMMLMQTCSDFYDMINRIKFKSGDFYYYCETGNYVMINKLHNRGYNWNRVLQIACRRADMNIIRLVSGKNPNYLDWGGAFYQACSSGNIDVAMFTSSRCKPGMINYQVGFNYACESGSVQLFDVLLNIIGDPRSWSDPIYFAGKSGNIDLIRILLRRAPRFYIGYALSGACRSGSIEMARYLLSIGVNITAENVGTACESGNIKLVDLLLTKYQTQESYSRDLAWDKMITGAFVPGNDAMIRFMMGKISEKSITIDWKIIQRAVCIYGSANSVDLLAKYGSNIDWNTGFFIARSHGNAEVASRINKLLTS